MDENVACRRPMTLATVTLQPQRVKVSVMQLVSISSEPSATGTKTSRSTRSPDSTQRAFAMRRTARNAPKQLLRGPETAAKRCAEPPHTHSVQPVGVQLLGAQPASRRGHS